MIKNKSHMFRSCRVMPVGLNDLEIIGPKLKTTKQPTTDILAKNEVKIAITYH